MTYSRQKKPQFSDCWVNCKLQFNVLVLKHGIILYEVKMQKSISSYYDIWKCAFWEHHLKATVLNTYDN